MEMLKLIIDDELIKSWSESCRFLEIRTLCRSLEAVTHASFLRNYFTRISCFFLDPRRLRVLKQITSSAAIVPAIRRVTLTLKPADDKSDSNIHDQIRGVPPYSEQGALNDQYAKYADHAIDSKLVVSILNDLLLAWSTSPRPRFTRAELVLDLRQLEARTGQRICPGQDMLTAIFTSRFPLHKLRCNDKLRTIDHHLMQQWQQTSHSRSGHYLTHVDYIANVAELQEADVADDGHSVKKHELLQRHHAMRTMLEQSPGLRDFTLRTSPSLRPVQAFDAFTHSMLHAVRYSNLRSLQLFDIVCDPKDLVNCLLAHKDTLRYLTLRRVTASTYSWDWVQLLSTLLDFQLKVLWMDRLNKVRGNNSYTLVTACIGPNTSPTVQIISTETTRAQSGETMHSTLVQNIQRGFRYFAL